MPNCSRFLLCPRLAVCCLVLIAGSTRGAPGLARDKAPTPGPATVSAVDRFYNIDEVQSIHLTVAAADLQALHAALPERIFVPARFRWGERVYDRVGLRYKGNSSADPGQRHKRSFLIKFDEYDEGQRFLGLRRISLDNGVQFGSLFSEPIITEILHDLRVPTQRANYARLFLNDRFQGVYVNVERIDETFLERQFTDAAGMLFKVDQGGPGGNLQFVGDDPAPYERTFQAETKAAKQGRPQLLAFLRQLRDVPDPEFANFLESELALDDFLNTTAVLLLSGAFDQLTGWNPHNYYLYRESASGRWHYLPWDLDVGFCETAFGQIRVLADWHAAWPAAGQWPNPLIDRIVADPKLLAAYRDRARDILEKYFEPTRLGAVLDARYALVREDLERDPFPPRRATNPEDRDYPGIVAAHKRFMRLRYDAARQQLDNPGPRPAMSRPPQGMGPPPQLVAKIQRVMRAAEKWQRNGQSVRPLQKIMEQIGPLLDRGKFPDAEKLVDEALKLIEEKSQLKE